MAGNAKELMCPQAFRNPQLLINNQTRGRKPPLPMNQSEAIKLGQEWLANSPPFDGVYVGPDFMSGNAGCVCRECCRRIVGRGCDLKRIANVPIWEKTNETCDLCKS